MAKSNKELQAARIERLKREKVCVRCGAKPAMPDRYKCVDCTRSDSLRHQKEHQELKLATFMRYGGLVCACCEEKKDLKFLHIDHMYGGGNEHRRKIGGHSGGAFYRWLRDNKYPEGFQVLCADCNLAKGFFGACPHKEQREKLLAAVAAIPMTY